MMKFCDIRSRDDLAAFLSIKRSHLTYVLYKKTPNAFYRSFEIPKKTGGFRQINASSDELKAIQKRLVCRLWEYQKSIRDERGSRANISHAFEKKKSIITNARIHRNKYAVLNIDLEHFFDSIHFGRVVGYFEKNRDFLLPHSVAIIIAQLACYNGCLPQGAPSSPFITNLICQILDMRIQKIAKQYKLDYSRYADDLTFSTNNRSFIDCKEEFLQKLEAEITRAGFSINHHKTRISLRDSKQTVTGLVVNSLLNVDSTYYRNTRAMAYCLYSKGAFIIEGSEGSINQLEGRFSFINQLCHYNNKNDGLKHDVWNLTGRERQYQEFLFYKYFIANEKPLIVTEGKTDIRYIKAALKKLYRDYPSLVTKDSNGMFHYSISFLHKSRRLSYYLGIVEDGANTMKNIFNYYSDERKSGLPNLFCKFRRLAGHTPKFPVILLFDNEISTGKRPLADFLSHTKAGEVAKSAIAEKLYTVIVKDSNLHIATNPLVDDLQECEIEMLFDENTRATKIEGRFLSLKSQYDTSQFYGKGIFSNYILQNYSNIDFCRFKPLLNALTDICRKYP